LKTALSKAPEKSYLRMDDLLLELRGDGLGIRLHRRREDDDLISQLPYKSVNLFLTITKINNKMTDLCGN